MYFTGIESSCLYFIVLKVLLCLHFWGIVIFGCYHSFILFSESIDTPMNYRKTIVRVYRDVFIFSIFTKIRTCFCVLQEAGELYEKGHSRVRLLWRYWRSTLPARGFWFMSLELVLMIVVVCLMRWNRSIAGHWTHTGTYSYWKKTIDWLIWQTLQFLINFIMRHDWCPQGQFTPIFLSGCCLPYWLKWSGKFHKYSKKIN